MQKFFCVLFISFLITGCAGNTTPQSKELLSPKSTIITEITITPSDTPSPSATSTITPLDTPSPIATSIPLHILQGTVFFDYNGDGEQGLAYKLGSNEPVNEPGIQEISICLTKGLDKICTTSAEDGSYHIEAVESSYKLLIENPAKDSETEFRYVNIFHGWIDIPSYEMNGIQVPEQQIPDTEIVPIGKYQTIVLENDTVHNVALMQGYLTLPFLYSKADEIVIWNGFDILNYQNESIGYFERQNEIKMLYDGRTNQGDPFQRVEGIIDGHNGLDFAIDVGKYIVYPGQPSSNIKFWRSPNPGDNEIILVFRHPPQNEMAELYTFAHLNAILIPGLTEFSGWTEGHRIPDLPIYRCQIIALSGDSGKRNTWPGYSIRVPQLHFDMAYLDTNIEWSYMDPFRTEVEFEEQPEMFWGSNSSAWTVDNQPFYCK